MTKLNLPGGEGRLQEQSAWNERFVAICLQKLRAPVDIEDGVRQLLAYLGESLRCQRVYVFEEQDQLHFSNTYEWCARGVTSGIRQLPEISQKDIHPWYRRLVEGETVVAKDVMTLRQQDPIICDILNRQQIRTIILSPMITEGTVSGLLGVDNPPPDRVEQIAELFRPLADAVMGQLNLREPSH